jgi:hypothetical protein
MARTMAPAFACQFLTGPNGLRNGGDDTGMTMGNERSSMATPNDRNGNKFPPGVSCASFGCWRPAGTQPERPAPFHGMRGIAGMEGGRLDPVEHST